MSKCLGCGITLQSDDEFKDGYVPKHRMNNQLCARCFKINHYNQISLGNVLKDNDDIIREVNKSKGGVLFLVDYLNINEEVMEKFKRIKRPKILVISKCDIIPKSIKENKIIEWLKKVYRIDEEVVFLSTKNNKNTNLIEKVNNLFNEIYILGFTNAGKSTFINNLIDKEMDSKLCITTSMIPNTTLDFIRIRLNDNLTIIDSPGFTYNKTLYLNDNIELIKRINPKRFICPITYQVKENVSINIEDKIIINSDLENSFTFYMSNDINLDKVYNLDKYNYLDYKKMEVFDNCDLVIKGIGFINIKKKCKLKIYSNYSDLIEIRESLF